MYRNGMLSAETEVRNGIVAAMHASRCNVIRQTDNSDTTKLPIKSVNLDRNGEVRRNGQIQAIIIVTCVR